VVTLADLASVRTSLTGPETDHLARMIASWSLLSDLSFSDMLLMAPNADAVTVAPVDFVVLGQVRPNNRATLIGDDLVGTTQVAARWPLVQETLTSGQRTSGTVTIDGSDELVPGWFIPVGFHGKVIAVLVRLQGPLRGPASLYEQAYLNLFEHLCDMVADATFPFREAEVAGPGMPRVGDGIILIDGRGLVEFATPNATNAMHRLGLYTAMEGRALRDLGLRVRVVERALEFGIPAIEEIDRGSDVAILFHCVPLLRGGNVNGVIVLMRDVSDLRRLNRLVLNKDQAIKEVHHRIKNNLQTISSLLRLQARRSDDAHSRTALLEAERRVRSIAVVHEVLSREPGDEVAFDEIVRSIVAMVEDSVLSAHPVEITVNGDFGDLSTDIATPLAVVLAELLTNAVEHAFVEFGGPRDEDVGIVVLNLSIDDHWAVAEIRDNGRGLSDEFSLEVSTSLGLSIVRDLVRSQLGGTIEMRSVPLSDGGGTYVKIRVPTTERP
jgi:two-component system, sensor histidine kinase PdtaS